VFPPGKKVERRRRENLHTLVAIYAAAQRFAIVAICAN
jgi:hypothetical protein